MSSTPRPVRTLPIPAKPVHPAVDNAATVPGSPHTPQRTITSTFASPSGLRAEEDVIVIEIGTRKLLVGFAGDAVPRGRVLFGPDLHRRAGDFAIWAPDYRDDWRRRATGSRWGRDHELWQFDLRGVDLGLVGDRLERALREAFTTYLLIDSRPRRMACVLPSGLPVPLLSTVLDTLFTRFQPPLVSLFSTPVMTAAAAGLRSALVVDLGWTETVVTSLYEYREVQCERTIRGGRMLVEQTHRTLSRLLAESQGRTHHDGPDAPQDYLVSFEECEELTMRMVWCKPAESRRVAQEQDTSGEENMHQKLVDVPLRSTTPPTSLQIPFGALAEPCENAFFASQFAQASFDDHELPLVPLLYRCLQQLPLDVRAICMARIIFTGGCSSVLGLRGRIFDELARTVEERGWDGVQPGTRKSGRGARRASVGPVHVPVHQPTVSTEDPRVRHDAAHMPTELDPIDEQLRRTSNASPPVQGRMRALESLGPWSGASLLAQLKVPAVVTVDRDLWTAQGAGGATRPADVDFKALQRQSMGPGGLMRGATASMNWTLGVWGAV